MIELQDVSKIYENGTHASLSALSNVSLSFPERGFYAILGPSGCGKTTLLNLISLLDQPSSGHLYFKGRDLTSLNEAEANQYRAKEVGFVFQENNLIPHLSVLSNVLVSDAFAPEISAKESEKKAIELLQGFGLGNRLHDEPQELSGGEKQRVAIARALLRSPSLILADEPTGSLDKIAAVEVMALLKKLSEKRLILLVSHNEALVKDYVDGVVRLDGGVVKEVSFPKENEAPSPEENKPARTRLSSLLHLAFLHIKNRPLKSLLLVLSGSIGLIGAGLVGGISYGLKQTSGQLESELLSDFPITVVPYYYGAQASLFDSPSTYFPSGDDVVAQDQNTIPHVNGFSAEYRAFLESTIPAAQLTTNYASLISVLAEKSDGSILVNSAKSASSLDSFKESFLGQGAAYHPLGASKDFVLSKYDVISGHYPEKDNEAFLLVGKSNDLPTKLIANLGLELVDQKIAASSIIGKRYKLLSNSEAYEPNEETASVSGYFLKSRATLEKEGKSLSMLSDALVKAAFYYNRGETGDALIGKQYLAKAADYFLNSKSTRTLQGYQENPDLKKSSFFADSSKGKNVEIVGILRPKKATFVGTMGSGLFYSKAYSEALFEENSSSSLATELFSRLVMKELPDPSQPTYPSFYLDLASLKEEPTTSLEMAGETLLSFIEMAENYGSEKTISSLEIYPKSFSEKKAFLSALDTYNAKHLSEVDKVVYTDFGGMFQGTLDSYLSLIYWILGIFAGVSLAVTILLVGLLSHNAVISRRKEIGLLRSVGASRHDILFLFLGEAFFLSLISGLFALLVTELSYVLVNLKVTSMGYGLYFRAGIPLYAGFLLVLLSSLIFLGGSLLPSYFTSREKPQIALRSD